MKFISKENRCLEWDSFVHDYRNRLKNKRWGNFSNITCTKTREPIGRQVKLKLHQHLLEEQRGLCIYCMQEIPNSKPNKFSHIEHVQPRSIYRELRFTYENLSVSCNGGKCTTEKVNDERDFCGHFKDLTNRYAIQFKQDQFLNPLQIEWISNCFIFDIEGRIKPNPTQTEEIQARAKYMIELVGLDNENLNDYRKEAYESLILIEMDKGEKFISELLSYQNEEYIGFITMMHQLFDIK